MNRIRPGVGESSDSCSPLPGPTAVLLWVPRSMPIRSLQLPPPSADTICQLLPPAYAWNNKSNAKSTVVWYTVFHCPVTQGRSHQYVWSGFEATTNICQYSRIRRRARQTAWQHVATVDRSISRDRWPQKRRFLVFKARRCHESPFR